MDRILPVLRVLLFASLSLSVASALSGCGLKGDLVLPGDRSGPSEASEEQAASEHREDEGEDAGNGKPDAPGARRG